MTSSLIAKAGLVAGLGLAASLIFNGAGTYKAENEGRSAEVVKIGIGYTHLEDSFNGRDFVRISLVDSYKTDRGQAEQFMQTGTIPQP